MFLPCNLNMIFNLAWIMSNYVKIVQNSVGIKRIKLKYIYKKIHKAKEKKLFPSDQVSGSQKKKKNKLTQEAAKNFFHIFFVT